MLQVCTLELQTSAQNCSQMTWYEIKHYTVYTHIRVHLLAHFKEIYSSLSALGDVVKLQGGIEPLMASVKSTSIFRNPTAAQTTMFKTQHLMSHSE